MSPLTKAPRVQPSEDWPAAERARSIAASCGRAAQSPMMMAAEEKRSRSVIGRKRGVGVRPAPQQSGQGRKFFQQLDVTWVTRLLPARAGPRRPAARAPRAPRPRGGGGG